jgi:uncharacterized protein YabN with tetrapyrrole methylase and pyrophosphatase domain
MADAVLEAARREPPVALALYGHPSVFGAPPRIVREEAARQGLSVRTLPGISCIDTLLVDLNLDPADRGLQIFEATELLLRDIPLEPTVPALILQPGSVETRLYSDGASRPGRFTRLREHLTRFYPPSHELTICTSSWTPEDPPRQIRVPLTSIESAARELTRNVTLYLPPSGNRRTDADLHEQFASREHLRRVSYPPLLDTARNLRLEAERRGFTLPTPSSSARIR